MARGISILKKIDLPLLVMYYLLVLMGLLTIYSSSYSDDFPEIYAFNKPYGKQLFWILVTSIIGGVILLLDANFIKKTSYLTYAIVILMLVAVLLMPPIKGARSWFKLGSFSLQPSEFAKFATAMAVSFYMSQINVKMQDFRTKLTVFMLLAIPGALILMQPDAGTLLVFFSFIFVMYREGLSGNILLGGFFMVIIGVVSVFLKASETSEQVLNFQIEGNYIFSGIIILLGLAVALIIKTLVLPRYRKERYKLTIASVLVSIAMILSVNWAFNNVFKERHRSRFQIMFGIKEDRSGDGYNIYQALSAIGSGEVTGKGFLKGTLSNEKYKHVPEQSTDFIFCSWSEEWGFFGNVFLILLYISFLIRIIMIAERQRSKYTRIFGYSIASILFFHFMINIAMVIGLAPVIGIPLPFFSKGGSSILSFSVMVFILLRLDGGRAEKLA